MSQFQYDIEYRNTKDHGNADALSRHPMNLKGPKDASEAEVRLIASELLDCLPVNAQPIRLATSKDNRLELGVNPKLIIKTESNIDKIPQSHPPHVCKPPFS